VKYTESNWMSFREDNTAKNPSPECMANFLAEIVKEVRYVDGISTQTTLTIRGLMPPGEGQQTPTELPEVEVSSDQFASMKWVMPCWGVRAIVMPGGMADDLRTMIQQRSKPEVITVYKQTGWQTVDGQKTYLHAGGGITADGNDPGITVALPPELMRYDLRNESEPADAVGASLDLIGLADPELTWPLLAATLAPVYGPCDFAVHISGRTGSFKSELASLFQSHFGAGFDARTLPGSWSSTANAIEALTFYAANALFTLDDFVPNGTTWQQRNQQAMADKIVRAQGNQAGRARLTDAASLQQTMYPRGVILSTGEDTPEGHSVRARMLILELRTGDIAADDLTAAQAARPVYSGTVAWLAQSLAADPANLKPRTEEIRSQQRNVGHSRTPGMLGRLIATAEDFLTRAAADGLITDTEAKARKAQAASAILAAGSKQQGYLEDADPVDMWNAAIRQVLASGGGHFRTVNGGVPELASVLGWSQERAIGEMSTFKARGPVLGWCSVTRDELYIDVTTAYRIITKAAGPDLALSKQTMFKRLKDAGQLSRVDETRSRNTVRVVAENHPRTVLVMSLRTVLELNEVTTDGQDDATDGIPFADPAEGDGTDNYDTTE
jgi:hypothetical protein